MTRLADEAPSVSDFINWRRIEAEMRQRKFVTVRLALIDAVKAVDEDIETGDEAAIDSVDSALEDIWKGKRPAEAMERLTSIYKAVAATNHPQLAALLAVYLYGRTLGIWELTTNWRQIQTVITAIEVAAREAIKVLLSHDEVEAGLVGLITELNGSIVPAMQVENGLNCSCPIQMETAANRVVERAEQVLGILSQLPPDHPDCREFVETRARVDQEYFQAVAAVTQGVQAYIGGGSDVFGSLVRSIDDVWRAERSEILSGDVYESELRSHRLGLEALVTAWPRLHVDLANVIYCYPFALRGFPPVALIAADPAWWESWAPAGIQFECHELRLSDMWEGVAPEKDRFTGIAITLGTATVVTTAGEELHGFEIELRLSQLGNHYLRVRRRLEGGSLHDLNQAVRRGTSRMGVENVTLGTESFDRMSELAGSLIGSFVDHLRQHQTLGDHALTADAVTHDGFHHVIVAAHRLSVEAPDGTRTDAAVDEVGKAAGASLILQPVRQAAATLEEWSRYPVPDIEQSNFLGEYAFVGDFAVRTANTTFGLLRGLPEFLIVEHEEGAEFVASLPALLHAWLGELERANVDYDVNDPPEQISDLQLALRRIVTEARTALAKLRSPGLCQTAVHRQLLDRLFDLAGIGLLEQKIQTQFDVLDAHLAELASVQSRHDELRAQKEEQQQRTIVFVLGAGALLVGIPSFAGLLQLLDSGAPVGHLGDVLQASALFGVLLILVGLLYWFWRRKGTDD
jgi:hypothetical protein